MRNRGFVWERPLRRLDLEFLRLDDQPWPVLGARVEDEAVKFALVEEDPEVFFTTPHYDGYPTVLVHLEAIELDELTELITDSWRLKAPKRVLKAFDDAHPAIE